MEMTGKRHTAAVSHDLIILVSLVLFALAIKILTTGMISPNGDPVHYWIAAKSLFSGLPYNFFHHRTVRFGIILPVYCMQKVFGTHPLVYYAAPFFMSLVQLVLLYVIALKAHGRRAAFLSCILLTFFSETIFRGTQIFPGVFESVYVLLAVCFLFRYEDKSENRIVSLLLMSVSLFFAYLAKETTVFFVPGFLLYIWMVRRKPGDALIVAGVLMALFAAETLLLYHATGNPLGRFGIVASSHFEGASRKLKPMTVLDLFERYTTLRHDWKISFLLYVTVSTPLLLSRSITGKVKALIIVSMSFFAGMTFAVKSVYPVTPALPFKSLYLTVAVPFMLFIISVACLEALDRMKLTKRAVAEPGGARKKPDSAIAYAAILALSLCVFLLLKNHLDVFEHDKKGAFPLGDVVKYHRVLNEAYGRGVPIAWKTVKETGREGEWRSVVEAMVRRGGGNFTSAGAEIDESSGGNIGIIYRRYKEDMKNLYIFTYVFCDTCRAPALRQYTGIACNVLFARINGRLVTFIVNDDFLENEGVKYFRDNKNKILKLGKLPFSVTEGLIGEI